MTTIAFDTHRFIGTLRSAGIEEKHATAFSTAFFDAQRELESSAKDDEVDLKTEIGAVRKKTDELGTRIGAVETRINALETRMGAVEMKIDKMEMKIEAFRHEIRAEIGALNSKIESLRWMLLLIAIILVAPSVRGLLGF
uniref:DUF1640 domain-containing protein n=2 Tax=unclassified Candidatus Kentrum TaxID=2643149 RepID=A0A451A4F8_9GAMM|nr:MAG: hypothetical protein BECKLPF1236A_GA0070988_1001127 [Candidatus Kentron sp. LPFa]VFK29719.1 MAG: hypothetical protein BECKLPF1236C_GA0070990_100932 [Candidatus Kentron sp. LPFa]VFK60927.1 MAG: hypothetical protein BECKUNK1418G_GA0071005_101429 [Candidatus Kentron sp. UNK]VFK69517.1 MAG: hypothetical protein BECKUNK1418H_GA0071006_101516 [Candidatus Kentron sp. UNK]